MNRRKVLSVLGYASAGILTPLSCASRSAATGSSSYKEMFLPHWKTAKEFTLAVLEAMPTESFNFKATPQEMSFGHLFMHLSFYNTFLLAKGKGENTPYKLEKESESLTKETAKKFVVETFDYTINKIESITEAELAMVRDVIPGTKHTGAELILRAYMHTTHHRGQAEVYLRLKEIKPPDFKF
jgi:uncharacterized damage-inducible protein DinB